MKAQNPNGTLRAIEDCYIKVPGLLASVTSLNLSDFKDDKITLNNLPTITDSKAAVYSPSPIIGRSNPLYTYSHSDKRSISMQIQLHSLEEKDIQKNLSIIRILASIVYPRKASNGAPFIPPLICQIKCGKLLADEDLCVVLTNYNFTFPTEVPWDKTTLLPYRVDCSLSWEVVYTSVELPNADRIVRSGR